MGSIARVEGLDQALRAVEKLNKDVRDAVRSKALERAGEHVRQDAHDKCPAKGLGSVDGFYPAIGEPTARSGAVRESIKYQLKADHALVGTNHMLGPDLEFGTSREKPHPFLRRSADDPDTQRAVKDIIEQEVKVVMP